MNPEDFNPFVTARESVNPNPSQVGKAVQDIISKPQDDMTVGDIIEDYQHEYVEELRDCIEKNAHKYESPFYVLILCKKEPWALNVMRNWFIARQTKPSARQLRKEYPNHMSTLYQYNVKKRELKILWSLPIAQDAAVVLRNPQLYHPDLVRWILDCEAGRLD